MTSMTPITCLASPEIQVDESSTEGRDLIHWENLCKAQKTWEARAGAFQTNAEIKPSHPTTIEALEEMTKVIPTPASYPMDPVKVEEFVNNFKEGKYREAVRDYLTKTQANYKPWATFEADLKDVCASALKAIKGNFVVWLTKESGAQAHRKSQYWVLAICAKHTENFLTRVSRFLIGTPDIPLVGAPVDVLFFDDMSYSGTQLAKDIPGAMKKVPKGSSAHLVVPYVTDQAKITLNSMLSENMGMKLTFHSKCFGLVQSVTFAKVKPQHLKTLKEMYPTTTGKYAVYLDSKIADLASTQYTLITGSFPDDPESKFLVNKEVHRVEMLPACASIPKGSNCPPEPYKPTLVNSYKPPLPASLPASLHVIEHKTVEHKIEIVGGEHEQHEQHDPKLTKSHSLPGVKIEPEAHITPEHKKSGSGLAKDHKN